MQGDKYLIFTIYTSFTDLIKGMPNELCLKLEDQITKVSDLYFIITDIEQNEKTKEYTSLRLNAVDKKREMLEVLDEIASAAKVFGINSVQLESLDELKKDLIISIERSGSKSGEFQREWAELLLDANNAKTGVDQRIWSKLLDAARNENSGVNTPKSK